MPQDLKKLAEATESLLSHFDDGGGMYGLMLPTKHAARFKGICSEAQGIIGDKLGGGTPFSINIGMSANRLADGPSYSDVEEAAEMMRSAARTIERRRAQQPPSPLPTGTVAYVDPRRITELQALQGGSHDFRRLIELCREINITSGLNCHMATAMLLRAILDHIPPVFGFTSFKQVAANHPAPSSLSKQFKHLQDSFRDKADMLLHGTIRAREDLPTAVQVNYSNDLDVILGEVIRLSS